MNSLGEIKAVLVDLECAIPYTSPKDEGSLWDDNLHFNPAGYDQFGRLVFESISSILAEL